MLRGDDVADLQRSLNHLGFDCGRPDGIFGPAAGRALLDFQRNSGLTADGVCGAQTVRTLDSSADRAARDPVSRRFARPRPSAPRRRSAGCGSSSVSSVDSARSPGRSRARSVNTVPPSCRPTSTRLQPRPRLPTVSAPTPTSVSTHASTTCSIMSYFAVPSFESIGGRSLAVAHRRRARRRSRRPARSSAACGCRCCARPGCRPCCARSGRCASVVDRTNLADRRRHARRRGLERSPARERSNAPTTDRFPLLSGRDECLSTGLSPVCVFPSTSS